MSSESTEREPLQKNEPDLEHLRLLGMFHYVLGALCVLCGFFPIIHLLLGLSLLTGKFPSGPQSPPPQLFGVMFTLIPALMMCFIWTMAILVFCAGSFLNAQRHYMFCFVIAAIDCVMFSPLGTVLGVFTIIVLLRPSVKALFAAQENVKHGD
ncbi:MAG: hypothetical protein NTW87_28925 [Planctomycetota bacterium]|nr:hypothetical protein [Planctomycetota bacterium]